MTYKNRSLYHSYNDTLVRVHRIHVKVAVELLYVHVNSCTRREPITYCIHVLGVLYVCVCVCLYDDSSQYLSKTVLYLFFFFFFFFFFFSFAYTTSPAAVMKLVVFFRSSKPPYNLWWSGVADGHCVIRSGWCLLHLWRTCSVVWSSSPGRKES